VQSVDATARGLWDSDEGVLLDAERGALAVRRAVGSGEAVLLSDASPLQNQLLAQADNAAFGLAVAGPPGRPVVFAESFHGYGEASGFDAVPLHWWWVLGGLALAGLVLALAQGRRLGPPELPGRPLPPARVEFAEALANQLVRARPPEDAANTARLQLRERLVRTLRLAPGADDEAVRAAAAARAIDPSIVDAALRPWPPDLLGVGQALRRLEGQEVNA
jgi:hypothetical protein